MRGQNRINTSNINTSSVKQVTLVCQTVSQSYVDNWKLSKIRKKMDNYLETNSGYEFKFWHLFIAFLVISIIFRFIDEKNKNNSKKGKSK